MTRAGPAEALRSALSDSFSVADPSGGRFSVESNVWAHPVALSETLRPAQRFFDRHLSMVIRRHFSVALDTKRRAGGPEPKTVDQPARNPGGGLTQNGRFLAAAEAYKRGERYPEEVRVYEKLRTGIWAFAGVFLLTDAWEEHAGGRRVFKFRLEVTDRESPSERDPTAIDHTRLIPMAVKIEVWERDKGQCVKCGSRDNLHFDHLLPYSKGGSSLLADNVQLLCARHNLSKGACLE